MALVEIFVAVVIAGVSCINATPPALAWSRSRDGRFLFLATATKISTSATAAATAAPTV